MFKRLIIGACMLVLGGCAASITPSNPLPSASTVAAMCAAEKAKQPNTSKDPDCVLYFVMQTNCNLQSIAPIVNMGISTVNPIAGSALTGAAALNASACTMLGYLPVPAPAPAPAPVSK